MFSHDINTRNQCLTFACRAGSVLAHSIAIYCDELFSDLLTKEKIPNTHSYCWCHEQCDGLRRQLGPTISFGTFQRVADFIHPHLFLHWTFDIYRIMQLQIDNYNTFTEEQKEVFTPIPQPFHIVDYLYNFFHFCDQFLDLPPSTWIHFVLLLHRMRTKYIDRFPICAHTFIPLVWTILLSVMKFDLDDHVDNVFFTNIVNFCLRPKTKRFPVWPAPIGKYLNSHLNKILKNNPLLSAERVVLISCETMNFYERILLINILEFDIMLPHGIHYFYCQCEQCHPLFSIYYSCAHYLQENHFSLDPCEEIECLCNPGVSVCHPIPYLYTLKLRTYGRSYDKCDVKQTHWLRKLLSYEYVNFTEMFYKRLQTFDSIGNKQAQVIQVEHNKPTEQKQVTINPNPNQNKTIFLNTANDFFHQPQSTLMIMT